MDFYNFIIMICMRLVDVSLFCVDHGRVSRRNSKCW